MNSDYSRVVRATLVVVLAPSLLMALALLPSTCASTTPFRMSIERTCPRRAEERPRLSHAPMRYPSSVCIQRLAYQLDPKSPRRDMALMPPLASMGRVYS